MTADPSRAVGVVLAAGAGTRFGMPKALARESDGTAWVVRAVQTLRDSGCSDVRVALGARRGDAAALVPPGARVVAVEHWSDGLGETVRTVLDALADSDAVAALVIPVDAPDLPASVCRRLVEDAAPAALARAVYRGEPGHPVLIGRDHWPALARAVTGDVGAGPYLRAHGARQIECADLWHGADVDTPRPA